MVCRVEGRVRLKHRFFHDTPATAAITLATVSVSLLLFLTHFNAQAALTAGFIPGIATGTVHAPPGLSLLPAYVTPLTATLVHGGIVHLGFNMLMLVYTGQMVERALGWRGLAVLYLVGAYAGAAGQWAQDPSSATPMIGASGAISAIIAAYALLFSEQKVAPIGPIPARIVRILWLAAAWIGIQLLTGIAGMGGAGGAIAIGAHIGGFLAGLILARPLLLWRFRGA